MKIIIFGLGSMGKRRARCLQEMGYTDLFGWDTNPKRSEEAPSVIKTTAVLEDLPLQAADAYFICTPPDKHEMYMALAIEYGKPCFVEASVLLGRLEEIRDNAEKRGIFIAPSCTLLFHPAMKYIKKIIDENHYGKVTNFSYHCGQYLPDWHPWESVKDYYVSHPLTGGCREIVPFELTWLVNCFGMPEKGMAYHGSTMDVGAPISDTYAIALRFKTFLGTLLVDVTSRYATRNLTLNFENAQLQWRWDTDYLKIYEAQTKAWKTIDLGERIKQATNYNENINEDMYKEEIASFLGVLQGKGHFPNNLEKDIHILTLLNQLEGSQHDLP